MRPTLTIQNFLLAAAFVLSMHAFGSAMERDLPGKAQRFAQAFVSMEQTEGNLIERFMASYLAGTKSGCRS